MAAYKNKKNFSSFVSGAFGEDEKRRRNVRWGGKKKKVNENFYQRTEEKKGWKEVGEWLKAIKSANFSQILNLIKNLKN